MQDKIRSKTLALDFDDTIVEEPADWNTPYSKLKLKPNAKEVINFLYKNNKIIIQSSRFNPDINKDSLDHLLKVATFLRDNGIKFDDVTPYKPFADYYIDNKGFKFESWMQVKKILQLNE